MRITNINPEDNITLNFKWKEALWCTGFNENHTPTLDEFVSIKAMASKMEQVREIFSHVYKQNIKIIVHSWIRPNMFWNTDSQKHGEDYNDFIGGAINSAHIYGCAVDFHPHPIISCNNGRKVLLPHLERLGLRMENYPGNWIHIDTKPVLSNRFFRP